MQGEVKKGVVITYATLIIGNLISFVYTPYMIRCLGQSEYGLISFVNSIIAYISLIDTGFGSAVVRYNADCIAKGENEKQTKINGMFLKLFSIIGIISIMIGLMLAKYMGVIFTKYTQKEVWIAQRLLVLAVVNLGISFPLNVFSSIVVSYERFTFNKGITLIKTLITPIMCVGILYAGGKSIPLVAVNLIFTIGVGSANIIYCVKKLGVKISFRKLDHDLIKEIWKYSFFIFLSMIAYQIYWNTDQFIIGKVMGAVPIAIYAVGMSFNNYFRTFSDFASGIFLPRFTKMISEGKDANDTLDELIKVSRIQLFICMLIYSGFLVLGRQFIIRWVGVEYTDSYLIALIVMTPQIVSIIQSLFATLLQAMNKHNIKSYIYLSMAVVNIALTILLVKPFGIIGCAVATAIGMTLNAVANNIYYSLFLHIDMWKYWKNVIKPMLLVAVITVLGYKIAIVMQITSYVGILGYAIFYSLVYLLGFWFIVFSTYERNMIIKFVKNL